MASDPYAALGVKKTATEAELKAAAAAYDLLKDPEQRRRFDAGEIDDQGQERPQRRYYRDHAEAADNPYARNYGFENDADMGDVFSDLFGRRGAGGRAGTGAGGFEGFRQDGQHRDFHMRGQDHRFTLQVDFMTAAKGGKTRITLPDGNDLEVTIPKGAQDGQTIRLKEKGGAGLGKGGPGDAYLTLTVAPDPQFRREGDDIFLTLPITLAEAVLGGKVATPTIDGPVNLTIPKGATTGQKLRLRGRGIKGGDQQVELKIVMPPKVDPELEAFMESWRKSHDYAPRAGMNYGSGT